MTNQVFSVITAFGCGVVEAYREGDGIFIVRLTTDFSGTEKTWALAYFQPGALATVGDIVQVFKERKRYGEILEIRDDRLMVKFLNDNKALEVSRFNVKINATSLRGPFTSPNQTIDIYNRDCSQLSMNGIPIETATTDTAGLEESEEYEDSTKENDDPFLEFEDELKAVMELYQTPQENAG